MYFRIVFLLLLSFMWMVSAAIASEQVYVSVDGCDDTGDGASWNTAFRTIQRGIDAIGAGDTLTIGPGEYFETVRREGLGDMDSDTLIRAAIPGTVLLRGDISAPPFRAIEGLRGVFVAEISGDVQAVIEQDTLSVLRSASTVAELGYEPGKYYYDSAASLLYVSSTDYREPDHHLYTVSVTAANGLELVEPKRVTVEGLAATGYTINSRLPLSRGQGTVWGIWMQHPERCVIRDCVAFLNAGGIGMNSGDTGGWNIVEGCTVYGNYSPFASGPGIGIYKPNHDVMRDNLAFETRGTDWAMQFYSSGNGPGLMDGNRALSGGFQIKIGAMQSESLIKNSVARGNSNSFNAANTIIGTHNYYAGMGSRFDVKLDNLIEFVTEEDLNLSEEFADPWNGDFRLQATSRFRGTGDGGVDRGPYPFAHEVYFVSPDGDDGNDGLALSSAWRTLGHAIASLHPGATLYLLAGTYSYEGDLQLDGTEDAPIYLRGRGAEQIRIVGGLRISESSNVYIERIQIDGAVTLAGSRAIAFDNCTFVADSPVGLKAVGVDGLQITQALFSGATVAAVQLIDAEQVFLRNILFDNSTGVGVMSDAFTALSYSGYNNFSVPERAWQVAGEPFALTDLPMGLEAFSSGTAIELTESDHFVRVDDPSVFAARGALGMAIGPHWPLRGRVATVLAPEVHSVGATSTNVQWRTSLPGIFTVAWGAGDETLGQERVYAADFATFSLSRLEAGKSYWFCLVEAETTPLIGDSLQAARFDIDTRPLQFTTLAEDLPAAVYFVRSDGDDSSSGLSPEDAWRTINHAAGQVGPGDTVKIAGGTYEERVRVKATGVEGAPITFTSLGDERVYLSSDGNLSGYFIIENKDWIHLDGLRFGAVQRDTPSESLFAASAIRARNANHLSVTRCMLDGRGLTYSGGLIVAIDSRDVLLANSVQIDIMGVSSFVNCPNVRIENNVFFHPKTTGLVIVNRPNDEAFLLRNLFTDGMASKMGQPFIAVGCHTNLIMEGNGFFLRDVEKSRVFHVYGKVAYERSLSGHGVTGWEDDPEHPVTEEVAIRVTLPEWETQWHESVSLVGDPVFAIFANDPEVREEAEAFSKRVAEARGWQSIITDWLAHGVARGRELDFSDLFATDPEYLGAGIGLQPEAFGSP